MNALRVAWRNILRKPRRAAITAAAVALNTAVLIFSYAMMDGMVAQLLHTATHTHIGDVQLHAPGYRADRSLYKSLPDPPALLSRAEEAGIDATPRSFGFGLVSRGTKSAGASFWGIDPVSEAATFELADKVERGAFLGETATGNVVLGRKLARSLMAGVGDELVAVVQAADGSLGNELYTVAGVLKSVGDDIDRSGILMHRADFDELFVAGGRVHEIALLSRDRSHGRERSADGIVALYQTEGETPAEEEIAAETPGVGQIPGVAETAVVAETWRQLLPTLSDMLNLSNASMAIFSFVFLLAAGLGVLNTMFMATHDRVRELGMLKALGATPARIIADVLVEAAVLATLAALAGGLLGAGAGLYFELSGGMDLSRWQGDSLTMSGVPFEPVYRFDVGVERVLLAVIAMSLACVAASLYPAIKAARLDPVKAMSHV